jgi:hypothetical protein
VGRVLAKFQEARAVEYDNDGYIKAKLSVTLQVLAELKAVFKTDAGLELNVSKTSILPKGTAAFDMAQTIMAQSAFDMAQTIIQAAFDMAQTIMQASPSLAHLTNDLLVDSFCPEGFIGIGVSIGTDAFVQSFVSKTCRDIIDDVKKLDSIQDGFIHYQLLRFFQTTRFNILIRILCFLITVCYNSNM